MQDEVFQDRPVEKVTVSEAAKLLGVTQSAVRKRIQRGTIPWDRDDEGRIYVYVDPCEMRLETGSGMLRDTSMGLSRDELVGELRDQVNFLRGELERRDTLLRSLMQRILELEPTAESREARETAADGPGKGEPFEAEEPAKQRSWLMRFFFGP
jgi:excisionase family DNA binding protein